MDSKRCGFPPLLLLALPLLLLATSSCGQNLEQCQVPRLDQEFCNSFYSVCLASPNKLCLAQSMSQCLGSTDFPSGILYSISNYLLEFIHRMMIIIEPPLFGGSDSSPPSPPTLLPQTQPTLPPPPPPPSTQPPRTSPPPPPPPPPPPRPPPPPPPPSTQPSRTSPPPPPPPPPPPSPPPSPPLGSIYLPWLPLPPSMSSNASSPPPPPTAPPPPPPSPQPQQPPQWTYWPFPSQQLPPRQPQPVPSISQPLPSMPQPLPHISQPLPSMPQPLPHISQPLPSMPQPLPTPSPISFWPPQTAPPLITLYQTGNDYLDYFISLLLSLPEKQIESIIGIMISDISMGGTSQSQVRSQDVEVLLFKLKFLLQRYSIQKFDMNYLDTYLQYLLSSNASLFNWFSTVLDQIFMDLKIQLPVGGSDLFSRFPLEGVFSTNIAYRQTIESCNGAPVSQAVCERYCTNKYGGNWIAIQYRERDIERPDAFDKSLDEYIRGFGDYQTGYWMGLACLSDITSRYKMELLIELADASGVTALAHYGHFRVGNQSAGYPLQLGTFLGGGLGDGLRSAEGRPFTTRDQDRDQFRNNCAVKHKGGWWYANCQQPSVKNYLNGYFSSDPTKNNLQANFPHFGVRWQTFDTTYVLVSTRMFMRRASVSAEVGIPLYDYGSLDAPYQLETFGGALGTGGETFGVAYSSGSAASQAGGGETYGVAYSGEGGASQAGGGETYGQIYGGGSLASEVGGADTYGVIYGGGGGASVGGETYDYATSDYALMMFDGGVNKDEGSYGVTYGGSTGGTIAGDGGMFEVLDG